jgi:acyl-CoA synthetase (AMP-forming)/AMP-acid ligase II
MRAAEWQVYTVNETTGAGGRSQVVSHIDVLANATSMVEVLQLRAGAAPDYLAFVFLIDGEDEGPRLTYAGLGRAAQSVAAVLRDGAEPGDRALLVYEPGLDFLTAFFGCLYAGLVPVPVPSPRMDRLAQGWQGLANVLADCRPRAVLTTGESANSLERGLRCLPHGEEVRCLATDSIDLSHAQRWHEPRIDPDETAYLQYTSGSTAAPKGVMVSHHNLIHNEWMLQVALDHFGRGSGVCWLPLYHDMGLVGGALQAVFQGSPAILMSPLGLLQKPFRWLQAVSRYRADTSGGPNFAYDLCVQRITPEQKAALDLGNWTAAVIGAEPISFRSVARFTEAFAPCGLRPEAFYPCYGLAEATLLVTGGSRWAPPVVHSFRAETLGQGRRVRSAAPEEPDTRTLVGCGRPWMGQQVVIVDPETEVRCPEETVGEIWVAGPSVTQGYWNRPEETRRTFQARIRESGEGPFLRTGDLGFVRGGELFVTGRLKDVIVIRGRNHYAPEIEATVQAVHPGLRPGCGAAFETGPDGHARLVVVQEVDRRCRGVDVAGLIGDIRQAVAERHELQVDDVQLLEPGSLPRTSSGKVRRHSCRAGYESGALRRWRGT